MNLRGKATKKTTQEKYSQATTLNIHKRSTSNREI